MKMNSGIFRFLSSISTIPDLELGPAGRPGSVTVVTHRSPNRLAMTLSEDLKERVLRLYSSGDMPMREVAELLNISLGSVHNVVSCHQRFGQVNDPRPRLYGRHRILVNDDIHFIHEVIRAQPSIYLDEIQHKLATIRGVQVSLATISRTLSRMGLTRKALSRHADERNEDVRVLWALDMAQYTDPDLFVFLDESAVDNRTVRRASGWSGAGTPAVMRSTFLRGVRHSILPALTSDGILALEIFEGSVNKERFLRFLRENIVCLHFAYAIHDTDCKRLPS